MMAGRSISDGRSGFTLMEMLIVIAIIAILAGLLLSGVSVVQRRQQVTRTKTLLLRIRLAVERYELDFGDYPPGNGDEVSGGLLYGALNTDRRNGPYLTGLKESELRDFDWDGIKDLLDDWEQPIRYTHHTYYDDEPGRDSFRITSIGRDGQPGTRDDIVEAGN